MGGRGAGSSLEWKDQLQQMAKRGEMPGYIMGTREQQVQVLIEIDRLYDMPNIDGILQVNDYGEDYVFVTSLKDAATSRAAVPSGKNAGKAERRGVIKMLVHNKLKSLKGKNKHS